MIRKLDNTDKALVMNYLERNHMECTFLIGNILEYGLENNSSLRRCGDYYGFFDNDVLKGVIPFYNLGSCIPHFESTDAIPIFVDLIKDKPVKYLLGIKKYIKPLYDGLTPYKITANNSDDSYFVNNEIKPFTIENAQFLEMSQLDIDDALNFVIEARKEFQEDITKEQAYTLVTQRPSDEDFIFEVIEDKIVAIACIQATTSKICQIGAVYTTDKERGKGYCKAIVYELCKRTSRRGKIPTLMVRNNNTPAVMAYTALGFKYYDDYLLVTFK